MMKRWMIYTLVLLVFTCLLLSTGYTQTESKFKPLHIIVFGAHPDDCELQAGGMAIRWASLGHKVKFVSVTNGDIGNAEMAGGPLAMRRTAEVKAIAKEWGIETEVLDIHDGELMPTLENRRTIVRLIREWQADIVIGPRPNDYHPDHRYTGVLMQDAAYMVTVKFFLPSVPYLMDNPTFLYTTDSFQKPNPFSPDVIASIDSVIDKKIKGLWNLESQIESAWATGNFEKIIPVPKEPQEREKRFQSFKERMQGRYANIADKYRKLLVETYGEEKGKQSKYAEAFELCEYGNQPSKEELQQMFMVNQK